MNRGPMSRLVKVPVKCRNCGKIKYNVVCKDDLPIEKQETEKPVEKKAESIKQSKQPVYKQPKQYSYINSVVKKQNRIVCKAYEREHELKE